MAYTGVCPDMCPEKERSARYGLYMSIFERDKYNMPSLGAMVKEYRRSGADQEEPSPLDLRTPKALENTLDYLVLNIMDDPRSKTQELASDWYDFLWDRLRAIRKDITQQNICDQASAILVERCARFHVHTCYAMNRIKDFDLDMNKRNLNDCLQMVRQMYYDLKVSTGTVCAGELEFQKYDILLHLNEDHLSSTLLMQKSDYRSSSEMKFITKVFNAYTNNDYYKFFQYMERADYMTSCVLSLYANKMRIIGLKTIINACATRQPTFYPSDLVIASLGFDDDEDLKTFALTFGFDIQEKEGKVYLILTKEHLQALRKYEDVMPPFKSKRLVTYKMQGQSVGQLVYGQPELPEHPNLIHAPTIVSAPQEVLAGRGGSPQIEAEVAGNPAPQLTWLKDGQPISERDLRTGHVEIVDLPTDKPDTVEQALKINDLRPTNVADYQVKAENPFGSVEIDSSMDSTDEPIVKGLDKPAAQRAGDLARPSGDSLLDDSFGPSIVSAPEEVVAGRGSSPVVEAAVVGKPLPQLTWFKDGQPISEQDLESGHLEIVALPTNRPDTVKQALKINDLKPADAAAYHVRAENPLGEAESEPTNVRIDRSMTDQDAPQAPAADYAGSDAAPGSAQRLAEFAPQIVGQTDELVAGAGSSPQIEIAIRARPEPETIWFKDGQPIEQADLASNYKVIRELQPDDTICESLQINGLKPDNVGTYHVRAQNALGAVESKPTSVRLDRSMSEQPDESFSTTASPPKLPSASSIKIARDMPAGYFKIRSLSSKLPTLQMPAPCKELTPAKRTVAEPVGIQRKKFKTIVTDMEEEKRLNHMFIKLTKLFTL